MYQPQLDSWDYYNYAAHAAVSVLAAGAKEPVFGVVWATASAESAAEADVRTCLIGQTRKKVGNTR